MKVLYFTATGNSLYVAKKTGGECYSIPQLLKDRQFEFTDDQIGLVFPSYGGSIPKLVKEYVTKAKFTSEYIFSIVTYGSVSGAVTTDLLALGKQNHIHFSYMNEIQMIDNYLPFFDMDQQIKNEPRKNIETNLAHILQDIQVKKQYIREFSVLRNFAGRIQKMYFTKSMANGGFDRKFYVEDSCNSCHVCEKVCPVGNIEVDKKPRFGGSCQQCLACIQHCPQTAIRLKNERSLSRFQNRNVLLKEIIDANNQSVKG